MEMFCCIWVAVIDQTLNIWLMCVQSETKGISFQTCCNYKPRLPHTIFCFALEQRHSSLFNTNSYLNFRLATSKGMYVNRNHYFLSLHTEKILGNIELNSQSRKSKSLLFLSIEVGLAQNQKDWYKIHDMEKRVKIVPLVSNICTWCRFKCFAKGLSTYVIWEMPLK